MSRDERSHWNLKYAGAHDRAEAGPNRPENDRPARVLEWAPPPSRLGAWALDVGCGRLRNARHLAQLGYRVLAIDASVQAFWTAERNEAQISCLIADLDHWRPAISRFELICDVHYLNRDLVAHLVQALVPNGSLLLEMRVHGGNSCGHEPQPRPFRLAPGEVPQLFSGLRVSQGVEELDDGSGIARYHLQSG
ncbi:MAG: methyltransferase domain-containing protein [Planctomycetota bacterium]